MSLYPDLSGENVEEVVLVLPAHHVRLTMINDQTKGIVGVTQSDLKCLLEGDRVRVVIDKFSIRLSSELFVLHDELERFVIGGVVGSEVGPVPGTKFRFVLDLVNHVPDEYLADFVTILMNTVNYRATFKEAESFSEMDTGGKIGFVIGKSASGISAGLRWTGEQANYLMKEHSAKYTQKTTPNVEPTQVSETTKKTVHYAAVGSKYLAKGTGMLASAIGEVASKVGQGIANEVAARNSSTSGQPSKHQHIWIQLGKVIKSSVAAYGLIWSALEETAKSTAKTARDEATNCVTHKHGQAAGEVTYTGMDIGVNATKTVFHVQDMGMKRICKNVAKTAGTEFLKCEIDKRAARKKVSTQQQQPKPLTQ